VTLYAVEHVAGPDQTIAKTVRMNFSFEEATTILEHLGSCGMRSTGSDVMMHRVLEVLDSIGKGETLFEEAA